MSIPVAVDHPAYVLVPLVSGEPAPLLVGISLNSSFGPADNGFGTVKCVIAEEILIHEPVPLILY